MAVAKKKSGHSGKPGRRVVSLGLPQKGARETAKEVVKISKSKGSNALPRASLLRRA